MNWTMLAEGFLATDSPLVPNAWVLQWGLVVSWACVFGALAVWLSRRWPRSLRLAVTALLILVNFLPGDWAPNYLLGLAFQVPSLVTVAICLYVVLRFLVSGPGRPDALALTSSQRQSLAWLALIGIVLGWVLLLDTLALLPWQIYRWGFSAVAVTAVMLLGLLPWIVRPASSGARLVSGMMMLVVAVFTLTHLPDGNVWDVLLDPLLWLVLQFLLLGRVVRAISAKWRASRATRV